MRVQNVSDPVYAPNSYGGPAADTARYGEPAGWEADGDMVRAAYVDHAEDDDWGQAGTLVREVLDDDARERLVDNIVGHLLNGVTEPVLERAFEYWRNVDKDLGDRVEPGSAPRRTRPTPRPRSRTTRPARGCRTRPEARRPRGPEGPPLGPLPTVACVTPIVEVRGPRRPLRRLHRRRRRQPRHRARHASTACWAPTARARRHSCGCSPTLLQPDGGGSERRSPGTTW